ncbi:cysteine-rich protective antigen [Hepatocystis sp. ex Piliocolobus tephrosceles]|nr:cysteine-rich protective antigen [Hepatocystis sp. ex Piliocolobus tephrosceles]
MLINLVILFFVFLPKCLFINNRKTSKSIVILNDDITTAYSDIECSKDIYFIFVRQLYKACFKTTKEKDVANDIFIQKKENNVWVTTEQLKTEKTYKDILSFHIFVDIYQVLIIECLLENQENDNNTGQQPYQCFRWSSKTGSSYNSKTINNIPFDFLNNNNIFYYATEPILIRDQPILLVCGFNNNSKQTDQTDKFVSCIASLDEGENWKEEMSVIYKNMDPQSTYYSLAAHVYQNILGFYFYTPVDVNDETQGGNYIECEYSEPNTFNCEKLELSKNGRTLIDITKLSGHYIGGYANVNNPTECYIYYTDKNAIILHSPQKTYNMIGCYRGMFAKIDERNALFIYLSSNQVYNIHSLQYIIFD